MNITRQQSGDLTSTISIELSPEDYKPAYDTTIKKYSKTASMPGFRPGHVPAGMIKKMYGRTVLSEVLNDVLSKELYKYIDENKLDMLGMPLPKQSADEELEVGKTFKFDYEIGVAPEVQVQLPQTKVPYFLMKIDEKMVETDVNDLRRRYGKFSNPESAEADSVLYGEFKELDENGEEKTDGNSTTTTLSIEMIRDEEERNKFLGRKKDEIVRFNPRKAVQSEAELKAMLKLEKDSPSLDSDYNFKILTVNKIEKAELNQEFFDKVLGDGVVTSEDEFMAKIREGLAMHFERDSDKKFNKDLKRQLLEMNDFPLPDDFLKRMLRSRQEKEISDHDFDHQYHHAAEDLRWQLITKKLSADNSINVEGEEVVKAAEAMISQQFAQYGMAPPEEEKLKGMVTDYIRKDDNFERIRAAIFDEKVLKHLKTIVPLDMMEVPYEQFVEKMQEKTAHELEHHH